MQSRTSRGIRVATYARYSTDLQSDRSVDDQRALCRSFASRNGLTIVAEFADRARSGASVIGRDGLMKLMDAARAREFDVVLVEALDRLSRDQEDLAGIHKRLTFAGIEIQAVHDGVADAVQVGIRGLVSTLFLADLKHKIRRGMTGVVSDGRHAGGRSFGYRPIPGKPGELEVVDEEAEVVRRIFREYLAGRTPRDIAAGLNEERVPAPRGTAWNASTINGNAQRQTGILLNPLYAGRLVWNRVRMVRDPETGRRISRLNPESEWQRKDVPHLAIVDGETFDAAGARKSGRRAAHDAGARPSRSRRLLSGLLRCGVCGSGMSVHDTNAGRTRVRCSRVRESGSCSNHRIVYLDRIERAVVDGVRQNLAHPDLMAEYLRTYREERRAAIAEATRSRDRLARRDADVTASIKRFIDALGRGTLPVEMIEQEVAKLEAERAQIVAELEVASSAVPVVELHPQAVERFRRDAETLHERIEDLAAGGDRAPMDAFRSLISTVIVTPIEDRALSIEVRGRLAALLGEGVPQSFPSCWYEVVAEDRFALKPTRRADDFTLCRLVA